MIPFNRLSITTLAVDVASVPANSTAEQTFTVPGLGVNDAVLTVSKPSHSSGLGMVNWRVSAPLTLAVTFMNCTGSAIDPAPETYTLLLLRPEKVTAGAARFQSM